MPLRDSAGNNAPDFSAQMVRNDRIQIVFTDPGTGQDLHPGQGLRGAGRHRGDGDLQRTSDRKRSAGTRTGGWWREATRGLLQRSGTTSLVFRYQLTEGRDRFRRHLDREQRRNQQIDRPGPGPLRFHQSRCSGTTLDSVRTDYLVDAVRPTLVRANALANGNDVTLTWDKALDEDSAPTTTVWQFFTVKDTSDDTSRQITAISVLGKVVTLTLSSVISATDQFTVSYEDFFRCCEAPFREPQAAEGHARKPRRNGQRRGFHHPERE